MYMVILFLLAAAGIYSMGDGHSSRPEDMGSLVVGRLPAAYYTIQSKKGLKNHFLLILIFLS